MFYAPFACFLFKTQLERNLQMNRTKLFATIDKKIKKSDPNTDIVPISVKELLSHRIFFHPPIPEVHKIAKIQITGFKKSKKHLFGTYLPNSILQAAQFLKIEFQTWKFNIEKEELVAKGVAHFSNLKTIASKSFPCKTLITAKKIVYQVTSVEVELLPLTLQSFFEVLEDLGVENLPHVTKYFKVRCTINAANPFHLFISLQQHLTSGIATYSPIVSHVTCNFKVPCEYTVGKRKITVDSLCYIDDCDKVFGFTGLLPLPSFIQDGNGTTIPVLYNIAEERIQNSKEFRLTYFTAKSFISLFAPDTVINALPLLHASFIEFSKISIYDGMYGLKNAPLKFSIIKAVLAVPTVKMKYQEFANDGGLLLHGNIDINIDSHEEVVMHLDHNYHSYLYSKECTTLYFLYDALFQPHCYLSKGVKQVHSYYETVKYKKCVSCRLDRILAAFNLAPLPYSKIHDHEFQLYDAKINFGKNTVEVNGLMYGAEDKLTMIFADYITQTANISFGEALQLLKETSYTIFTSQQNKKRERFACDVIIKFKSW